ncbi:MAG: hypothetical protein GY870_12010 [archaeon]|nr:hypothetical protein [archaeon]
MSDKEYIERLIQDMKVNARDIKEYRKKRHYTKVINNLECGMNQEYHKPT